MTDGTADHQLDGVDLSPEASLVDMDVEDVPRFDY